MSIVLVCWNNKDYLGPCLDSLYQSNLETTFDVVVVDNGSTDGSQDMLRKKYPQVKIIQNAGNVGLGKASNQGIEATTGEFILLQDGEVKWHDTDGMLRVSRRQLSGANPDHAMFFKYVDPEEREREHYEVYEKALQHVQSLKPKV